MGHYGQSQTPGQGQDSGHYPTKSKVTTILRVVGGVAESLLSSESSTSRVIGENTFWAFLPC